MQLETRCKIAGTWKITTFGQQSYRDKDQSEHVLIALYYRESDLYTEYKQPIVVVVVVVVVVPIGCLYGN